MSRCKLCNKVPGSSLSHRESPRRETGPECIGWDMPPISLTTGLWQQKKKKKILEMAGIDIQHQHLSVVGGAVFRVKARRRLEVKRLKMLSVTFKIFQQLLLLYHMKRKRMVTERSRDQGVILLKITKVNAFYVSVQKYIIRERPGRKHRQMPVRSCVIRFSPIILAWFPQESGVICERDSGGISYEAIVTETLVLLTRGPGLFKQEKFIRGQMKNSGRALMELLRQCKGIKKQVRVSLAHSLGEGEGRPGAFHGGRGSLHDLPTPLGVLYAGTTLKTLLLLQHLRSSSWVFFFFGLSVSRP